MIEEVPEATGEALLSEEAIQALAQDFKPDDEPTPEPVEEAVAEPEAEPTEEVVDKPEVAPDPISDQILRMAARERKVREAEEAVKGQLEEKVTAGVKEFTEKFSRNPVGALVGNGATPEQLKVVADSIYYHLLGDEAPPEAKAQQALSSVEQRMADMEARLEAKTAELTQANQQAAAQRQYDQYMSSAKGYMAASTETPYLSNFYASDPSDVLDTLAQSASQLMQDGSPLPSVSDVAKALEAQLEKQAQQFASVSQGATTPVSTPKATSTEATSLSSHNPSGTTSGTDEFDIDTVVASIVAGM